MQVRFLTITPNLLNIFFHILYSYLYYVLYIYVFKNSNKEKKGSAFYKAKQEYQRKQEEIKNKKEEAIRVKTEREEALRKYKEKKIRAFKVLSKKTKKGQPVMKGRIEMLLEKIQQNLT